MLNPKIVDTSPYVAKMAIILILYSTPNPPVLGQFKSLRRERKGSFE